jgi:hypothetical protein
MARRVARAGERAGKARTMQTMSIPQFGGPDVLTVIEKQVRRLGPGRVSGCSGRPVGEAIGKPTRDCRPSGSARIA